MEGKSGRRLIHCYDPTTKNLNYPSKIVVDGKTFTEQTEAAKALCTFFAGIGEKTPNTVTSQAKSYKNFLGPACLKSMAVIPVTSLDVSMMVKT